MTRYAYQIASGWDNEAGYTNIESLVVAGTTFQLEDVLRGMALDANTHYVARGGVPLEQRVIVANAGDVQNGYTRKDWHLVVVSDVALDNWISTYVGQVTVDTTIRQAGVYEDWNAMARYPQFNEQSRVFYGGVWWYQDVVIPLLLVSAT